MPSEVGAGGHRHVLISWSSPAALCARVDKVTAPRPCWGPTPGALPSWMDSPGSSVTRGGLRGILGAPLSSRRALWRGKKNTFQHLQILKMDFSQGNRDSEHVLFPEREPGKQRGRGWGRGERSQGGGGRSWEPGPGRDLDVNHAGPPLAA